MGARKAEPRRRAEPGRRVAGSRSTPRRRAVRPRRGRMAMAGLAALVTIVALLGGVGALPLRQDRPAAAEGHSAAGPRATTERVQARVSEDVVAQAAERDRLTESEKRQASAHAVRKAVDLDLPSDSGEGRRAVFDMSAQRVWIVGSDDDVERTYLVSGSVLDNLKPGTYSVYSRSRYAVGIDDSGTMEYFVRFTRGDNAAIGFHNIPEKDGVPLQTKAQLGTPLSHGCIRQDEADAIAMWDFAQLGTTVVVTA